MRSCISNLIDDSLDHSKPKSLEAEAILVKMSGTDSLWSSKVDYYLAVLPAFVEKIEKGKFSTGKVADLVILDSKSLKIGADEVWRVFK